MKSRGSVGAEEVQGWFAGRLPDAWFTQAPDIEMDRDEIIVVGTLADPTVPENASSRATEAAHVARIEGFREDTRVQRMRIADEAERRFDRTISWGAQVGGRRTLFTTLSVPAMTRLRMAERAVLDTLIEAGVARSRSHALAWCVRLVAERQDDWLDDLRGALEHVREVRAQGPKD